MKSSVHGGNVQLSITMNEGRQMQISGQQRPARRRRLNMTDLQNSEVVGSSRLERSVIMKRGVEKKRAEKICARVRLLMVVVVVVRSEWCV